MLQATYRNLLQVFVDAGHTRCTEILCGILRNKCEYDNLASMLLEVLYQKKY